MAGYISILSLTCHRNRTTNQKQEIYFKIQEFHFFLKTVQKETNLILSKIFMKYRPVKIKFFTNFPLIFYKNKM